VININKQAISSFVDFIKRSKNIAIFTHTNPDGDAIGSALALVSMFKQLNIETNVIIPNYVPENLRWLPNFETIHEGIPKIEVEKILQSTDIVICVDFNQASRVEKYTQILNGCDKPLILIDHHTNPQLKAEVVFSYIEVSSTCELIYHIFKHIPIVKANVDFATCIYVGIVTDTGVFKYSSNYISTFQTVIDLINLGIDKDTITQNIYNTLSENSLRLLGYSINERMVVLDDLYTAYIYLSSEDLKKFNYQPGDTENFVNYPLSIKYIYFTALFQERESDIKISFRSVGSFEVNKFAEKYFNGGGHKNASGGKSYKSLDDTINEFKELAKKHAKEIINSKK
jgi:phosphoesterase RecJ-like protein